MLNSHPQIGISFLAVAAFVGAICAFLLPVETKDREMEVKLCLGKIVIIPTQVCKVAEKSQALEAFCSFLVLISWSS